MIFAYKQFMKIVICFAYGMGHKKVLIFCQTRTEICSSVSVPVLFYIFPCFFYVAIFYAHTTVKKTVKRMVKRTLYSRARNKVSVLFAVSFCAMIITVFFPLEFRFHSVFIANYVCD